MPLLRTNNRPFRRPILECLEDRRTIGECVAALGSVLALGGAAYAVVASQIQIVPETPSREVLGTTTSSTMDMPPHVSTGGGYVVLSNLQQLFGQFGRG